MRKIYKAIGHYQSKGIPAMWFLRDCVQWLESRGDKENKNKGVIGLVMDYADYVLELDREFKGMSKNQYYKK